jgi:hypothetical protein
MPNPHIRLMLCRTGIGVTVQSNDLVRKSQKTLGQKKHEIAAAA